MKGQVFDYNTLKCVDPEVGPEDWYVYIFLRSKQETCYTYTVMSINMSIKYILILIFSKCWYECDQDISKNCPTDCLSNCKCPGSGDS